MRGEAPARPCTETAGTLQSPLGERGGTEASRDGSHRAQHVRHTRLHGKAGEWINISHRIACCPSNEFIAIQSTGFTMATYMYKYKYVLLVHNRIKRGK